MAWYDGLTHEEVEEAIAEGRAPGSQVPGGVIEVPSGHSDWLTQRRVVQAARDRLAEFRRKWQEDSELIRLAKEMERTRIGAILRAKGEWWNSNSQEPDWVRSIVSAALNSIADSLDATPYDAGMDAADKVRYRKFG